MRISAVLGACVIGLTAAATAQPALGFNDPYKYFSEAKPLTAFDDGVAQAEMHGKFFVEEATYLRNNTNQRDPRPGGDKVFERTEYWYSVWNSLDGEMSWKNLATDQGPKTDSGQWYHQYDHNVVMPNAEKGRMRTQICEDHGIFQDPCSLWPQWTTDL